MSGKILIVGAGAMACLFAAELVRAGIEVTMLDRWRTGVETLNRSGVQVVDPSGTVSTYTVRAYSDPAGMEQAHLALVLVKSWQTGNIAAWLRDCLTEDGLAVSLQNGLGNYETLVGTLGAERASAAVTTLGATQIAPAQVRVHAQGDTIFADHPRLAPLLELLGSAGLKVSATSDITGLLWGKLVVNAAVNPLTALLDVPNGRLLELPDARDLMRRLAAETESVADTLGIRLPFPSAIRRIEEVLHVTAENSSSMRQDLARGAPTEIDAINGAVARYGEECGVATPCNHTLWRLVRARVGDMCSGLS